MGRDTIRIGDFQFGPSERAAINRVMDSGRISEGPECRAFEDEYASYVGTKYCVAVSSGTSALMVGLLATKYLHGIRSVLMPALTFVATANAARLLGLEVKFGDVEGRTFTLSPQSIIWQAADLVLPVHLFGFPVDMDTLVRNSRYAIEKTIVAEDACEAHGTTLGGQMAGSAGLWGAFSFYIAHTIQAGEFGCLVTNDKDIADMARSLKAHGRVCGCRTCTRNTTGCPYLNRGSLDPRFLCLNPGFNFKPMEWQAAIARVQLGKVDENISKRRENVGRLNVLLDPIADKVQLPPLMDNVGYMAYPIVLRTPGIRDSVISTLSDRGVESRPIFGCIPTQQTAYREWRDRGEWPVADYIGANGFYVGCHQYLEKDDVEELGKVVMRTVIERTNE